MNTDELNELKNRIDNNPEDYEAVELYAMALSDTGENKEALKYLKMLKGKFPENARIYYNIGIILEKLKMNEDAVCAYTKAHELDENDTDFMFNLASALIKVNKLDDAEKLFLKVIETDTEDENAYFHLGEIYTRKKDAEKAVKYLSRAVELDNNDTIAKFYLAYQYKRTGDISKAVQLYNEVTEQNPDYSWAYFNLASIYTEQGEEDKAAFYLEKTLKTNPMDLKALKLLVKLLVKQKKYADAEELINQKLSDMPDEADLYYLLAGIYKKLENKKEYFKFLMLADKNKLTFSGDEAKLEKEIEDIKNEGS